MTAHQSGPVAVIRSGMADSLPVKRALPLKLWLALEDDVIRHKAEIAQGFAEARKRLLPEPKKKPRPFDGLREMEDLIAKMDRQSGFQASNAWRDPYTGASIIHNNAYADASHGLFGLGFLGL